MNQDNLNKRSGPLLGSFTMSFVNVILSVKTTVERVINCFARSPARSKAIFPSSLVVSGSIVFP
jgi:hypothetical protein